MYKFRYTLSTSIFNRLTGVALSFALLLLSYWLMVWRAARPRRRVPSRCSRSRCMKGLYGALLFSFCYHLWPGSATWCGTPAAASSAPNPSAAPGWS